MNLYGVQICPHPGELSVSQCERAAKSLGMDYGPYTVSNKYAPYRCIRYKPGNRLVYNTYPNGNGNSAFTPVCNYGKNNE